MLKKVGNWNFDIFLFDKLTNGELNVAELPQERRETTSLRQPDIKCVANSAIYWPSADTADDLVSIFKKLNQITDELYIVTTHSSSF